MSTTNLTSQELRIKAIELVAALDLRNAVGDKLNKGIEYSDTTIREPLMVIYTNATIAKRELLTY